VVGTFAAYEHTFWKATHNAFYANEHFSQQYHPYARRQISQFRKSFLTLLCKIVGFNKIVDGIFPLNDVELWHAAIDQVQAETMPVVAPTLVVPAALVGEAAAFRLEAPAPLFEVAVEAPPIAPPILAPIIEAEGINQVHATQVPAIAPAQVVPAAPVGDAEAAVVEPAAPLFEAAVEAPPIAQVVPAAPVGDAEAAVVEPAAPLFEAAVEAPPIAPPILAPIIGAEGPVMEPAVPIIAAAPAPILAEAAPLLAALPVVAGAGAPMDMVRAIIEQTKKRVREAAMEQFAQLYVQTTKEALDELQNNGP
jgi:hypothetical protein